MHNSALHATLEAFTSDAAGHLTAATADGAEVPFDLVEAGSGPRGRPPLYCYRPLTGSFIRERLGRLSGLATYAPAARALASLEAVDDYLEQRGEPRRLEDPRERAGVALGVFLSAVFAERSEFGFDPGRFEAAYAELERALYDGNCVTTVIAPLLGLALDRSSGEVHLGEGLSLISGDALPDAPAEAVWSEEDDPNVLAVLTVTKAEATRRPVSEARVRFRRVVTALRLFERGGFALGPIAWTRTDTGAWRPVPTGGSARPRVLTLVAPEQEDELRAFCNLTARRLPGGGEIAWALARYEMGCERLAPFEALTDYLLALRAVLEPEGPASGHLARRLGAICAQPEDRPALAERVAYAISLERAVISGLAPSEPGVHALVDEIGGYLRAVLRDVVCGHLDADLRAVADDLLATAPSGPHLSPDPVRAR